MTTLAALWMWGVIAAAAGDSVVPLPQEVRDRPAIYQVGEAAELWLGPNALPDDAVAAEDLARRLAEKAGLRLSVGKWKAPDLPPRGFVLGDVGHWFALAEELQRTWGKEAIPREEQGYAILVAQDRVLACGRDAAGTYYGACTLAQLVSGEGKSARVRGAFVRDWPDLAWRGAMSSRLGPVDGSYAAARAYVDRCAALKLNLLLVGDDMNHFDGPHLDWTVEQTRTHNEAFKGFVDYARRRHMKVIAMCGARKFPVIYFGKHVTGKPVFFIRDAEGERLMARRVNEVIDLIRPDAVYIGQDELVNAYPVHRRKPLLERPIIGREFVPPAGKYAGVPPHVLWSEFLRFYRDLLAPRGVELCLWGDCLLSSEEFDGSPAGKADGIYGGLPDNLYLARETSPKDVLLLDWHYNSTWCYPSVDRLTGAGFRLLAAPWEQAGNTFFFCKYLKAHGGPGARGIFNTWWSDPPPLEERLPHIADCAWTVGRLAVMPPDLAKLISVAEEAEAKPLQHLGPGPFQKDLRLSLPDGGHFFSDGWIEFRPMPEGLGVKADRRGYLDFCFAAEKGTFERLSIRVWFRNLGHNAVLVQAGERKTDHWSVLGEDRDWQGEPLDLREHARGQCRVFVRFRAHSRADLKAVTACLTRLAVEGEVAK